MNLTVLFWPQEFVPIEFTRPEIFRLLCFEKFRTNNSLIFSTSDKLWTDIFYVGTTSPRSVRLSARPRRFRSAPGRCGFLLSDSAGGGEEEQVILAAGEDVTHRG